GDGDAVAELRRRVVGKGDALLGVDVLDKAGAVEAAGARAAPDVRRAEVLHCDADDAAVLRGRRHGGLGRLRRRSDHRVLERDLLLVLLLEEPGFGLALELGLASGLLSLETDDLVLDRREQPLPFGETGLDVGLLGRTLRDDPRLQLVRPP